MHESYFVHKPKAKCYLNIKKSLFIKSFNYEGNAA